MTVTIRLFAWLRDAAGTPELPLTLENGGTGDDVRRLLAERYPDLRPLLPGTRLALNAEYAAWEGPVHDGDELALIPPVSGG